MGRMTGWALGTKMRLAIWATPPSANMTSISGTTSAGALAVLPTIINA